MKEQLLWIDSPEDYQATQELVRQGSPQVAFLTQTKDLK
jgi:hypothetical protein